MLRRNAEFRMQNSDTARWARILFCLHSAFCILHLTAAPAAAQDFIGQPIVEIVVEQEGERVTDPAILNLVETRVGQPLSMTAVRETVDHLLNLRRFDDVQPRAEAAPGGVLLRYLLMPSHPVDRIEFTGNGTVSEGDLRRLITDRFDRSPNPARATEIAAALKTEYRRRGYPAATVNPRVVATHKPDRSTLVFDIDPGRRARIADVQFRYRDDQEAASPSYALPDIRTGEPYDAEKVEEALDRWEERMRDQGFYQANASVAPNMVDDAYLIVNISRGPLVMLEFVGDPLPEEERDRLVPIRTEAATDEDLLEDAKLAIEQYFRARGYRDATAEYAQDDKTPGQLKITFRIARGPHYTIDAIRIMGNEAISTPELEKIVTAVKGGEERRPHRGGRAEAKKANDGCSGLLRGRCQRPYRRSERRHEFPPRHSITSSASESSVGETMRPILFAVLRLSANTNLLGCSIGRSAALAPRRMRSAKMAARRWIALRTGA